MYGNTGLRTASPFVPVTITWTEEVPARAGKQFTDPEPEPGQPKGRPPQEYEVGALPITTAVN
jgi:hypothetical protein